MHLFRVYPKSIETIKLFQEKIMNNEFYKEEPKNGLFFIFVEEKTFVVVVSCYNVSECYILNKDDVLEDYFVLNEFSNLSYKNKTLLERINEKV